MTVPKNEIGLGAKIATPAGTVHGVTALGGVFFDPPVSSFFEINAISREKETGSVTIEFNSSQGAVYGVEASSDLLVWDELDDGVIGEKEVTIFIDDIMGPENKGVLFYRVRKFD